MKRYITIAGLIAACLAAGYGQATFEYLQYQFVRWSWEHKLQAINHRADMRDMDQHYKWLCYGVGE